jgi:hypothetical protein
MTGSCNRTRPGLDLLTPGSSNCNFTSYTDKNCKIAVGRSVRLKNHKKRATTGLILLLIAVFCLGNTAFGQVLCIGFDGHQGVENSSGGFCASAAPQGTQVSAKYLPDGHEDSHCGQCVDVGFADIFVVKEFSPADFPIWAVQVNWLSPPPALTSISDQGRQPWLRASPQHKTITTTILLI